MKKYLYVILCCLLSFPIAAMAEPYNLEGVVLDETGETLPGVSILVKGTQRGGTTDVNGIFNIQVSNGETLVFSYVGYATKSVKIAGQKSLEVKLEISQDSLDEVIVVGYGTQSKRTVTSSIASVNGSTLEGSPINTAGEGLKGKIAGVRVYNANNSPGAEATFIVRGGSSISQNNEPLILVDGIERSMEGINPNDIESIEVLKDAASSAIYGSRASNGVVLITTKKGAPGRMRITFEASFAHEDVERMIDYLPAEVAVPLMRDRWSTGPSPNKNFDDGYAYSAGNTSASIYSTRYLQPGESVPAGWKSCVDPLDPSKTLVFEDNDWSRECFRPAFWQNYYLGVDGGNDLLNYVGSIGYTKDSGVGVGTGFNRFSARANVVAKIRKNLKFTSAIDYSQTNTEAYASQYQVISRGLMTPSTQRRTYVSDDQWFGTPTPGPNATSPNPTFYSYYNDNSNKVNRTGLVGTLDWEPLKMWHIVGSASFFTQSSSTDAFHRADPLNGTRWADASNTDIQRMKLEAYTNYSRTFADNHSLSAMVGYSYQRYDYRYLYAKSQGHATDKIPTLNAGSTYTAATSTKQKDINIGYFGRINYDYMKKYMLTLTFREDGSSRFAEGNQWGFFPGASAGWAMHAEDFMQPIEWINNLKWRVSYGQTGNNSVGYYDAFGLYSVTTSYDGQPAVITSAMPNPTLKWEKTTQLDVGFDFSVLNDRIALNVDYFNKITDNLITTRTLPNTSGFGSVLTNLGKVRFHGFDLELNTRNIVTNDFTWESKFTITYVKNKVLKLPEEEGENKRDKNRQGGYKVTMADGSIYEFGGTAEGEPLGRIYGYKHAYIITTPEQAKNAHYDASSKGWDWTTGTRLGTGKKTIGDYEWCDLNGDGIINGNDMYELGNTIPTTTGGLSNTLSYKGFTLNVFFDFALGHSVCNGFLQRQVCNFMNGNTSIPSEVLKAWNVGDDPAKAKYARFSGNDSDELNKNYRPNSDIFCQKADYLCLREVSLSYQMPKKLIKKAGMQDVRFTFAGNNLHYFTNVIGMSPEVGTTDSYSGTNNYPPIRKFSFSVKVSF